MRLVYLKVITRATRVPTLDNEVMRDFTRILGAFMASLVRFLKECCFAWSYHLAFHSSSPFQISHPKHPFTFGKRLCIHVVAFGCLIQYVSDTWSIFCTCDGWICPIEMHASRWEALDPVNGNFWLEVWTCHMGQSHYTMSCLLFDGLLHSQIRQQAAPLTCTRSSILRTTWPLLVVMKTYCQPCHSQWRILNPTCPLEKNISTTKICKSIHMYDVSYIMYRCIENMHIITLCLQGTIF